MFIFFAGIYKIHVLLTLTRFFLLMSALKQLHVEPVIDRSGLFLKHTFRATTCFENTTNK